MHTKSTPATTIEDQIIAYLDAKRMEGIEELMLNRRGYTLAALCAEVGAILPAGVLDVPKGALSLVWTVGGKSWHDD